MKLPISSAEDRAIRNHLFVQEIFQKAWLWGLLSLVFGLIFPLGIARSIGNYTAAEIAASDRIFPAFMENQELFCILMGGLAVVIALVQFGFLYKRETVDFYFSLPISRKSHFRYRFFSGFLFFAVPFGIMYWISIMVAVANDIMIVSCFREIIQILLLYLLFFWDLYVLSILAMLAAGNYLPAVVMEGVVHLGCPIFCVLLTECQSSFFRTYVNVGQSILPGYGSILITGKAVIRNFHRHIPEHRMAVLIMLFLAVLLPFLAEKLFLIRPAEKNGSGMVWPLFRTLIHGAAVICGGIFVGLVMRNSSLSSEDFWLYSGVIIGCLFTHLILQMMMQVSFRAVFQGGLLLLTTTFLCVVTVSIFRFDLLGYDRYIPEQSKVESIGISLARLDYYREYPRDMTEEEYEKWNVGGINSYLDSSSSLYPYKELRKMRLTDMEPVYTIINYSMDHFEDFLYRDSVVVCYRLKSGKPVYRRYPMQELTEISDPEILAAAGQIFSEKEFKNILYPVLRGSFSNKAIQLDPYYHMTESNRIIEFTDSQFQQLLNTYREELVQLDFEDLRTTEPLMTIRFSASDSDYYNSYPIYPSFTKTIEILQKKGADCTPIIRKIQKIQVQYDDNGNYRTKYITDAEQMEELKRMLIRSDYYNMGLTLKKANTEYLFSCTVTNSQTLVDVDIDYYLPENRIPDFCKFE